MQTLLLVLALIAAGAALVYAWSLQRELAGVTRRLDRYNRALFDASDDIRDLRADLERTTAELRVAIRQAGGSLRFTPETTMQEAALMHPQASELLARFHVGGCSDCAAEPTETLQQVAAARGLPLDALLENLNQLVAATDAERPNGAQRSAPTRVKIPNMVLELE